MQFIPFHNSYVARSQGVLYNNLYLMIETDIKSGKARYNSKEVPDKPVRFSETFLLLL